MGDHDSSIWRMSIDGEEVDELTSFTIDRLGTDATPNETGDGEVVGHNIKSEANRVDFTFSVKFTSESLVSLLLNDLVKTKRKVPIVMSIPEEKQGAVGENQPIYFSADDCPINYGGEFNPKQDEAGAVTFNVVGGKNPTFKAKTAA